MSQLRQDLQNIKRIVIKVGTSTLSYENGKLNLSRIETLVRELIDLKNSGYEVILVSSGAVGAGMGRLNISQKAKDIPTKQALAAIGQGLLMHIYEKLMNEYGQLVAQILLTEDDLKIRNRFLNARNTLNRLIDYGAIPIINENDTVSYQELRLGDNDTLASLVATLTDSDLVVLLTDIDGLYTSNPKYDDKATLISDVYAITDDLERLCGESGHLGTGGMLTKVRAARIACKSGIPLAIIHGNKVNNLKKLLNGKKLGTLFYPSNDVNRGSKKHWLAFGSKPKGSIDIDEGAQKALLEQGKSLLAIGVTHISGSFENGDIISIKYNDKEIAKGITNYSSQEIDKILGKSSSQFKEILGYHNFDEIVHRDNLGFL